ncbi:MAG: carbohydrate kinase family protein [Calditrichaeota bacterium]|nr:carbohydrate kinase family protein [Calditrichota bacterium]
MENHRSGILAAGNWLLDHVKIIDQYPEQESLAIIQEESLGNGGGPYNLLKDLARLKAPFSLAGIGLLGDDSEGKFIRADCRTHGIDVSGLKTTDRAPTSYTDVMTVRSTGKRTFFHQKGANAFLDESHFELEKKTARIFYLGYVLLLDTLDVPGSDGRTGAARVLQKATALGFQTAVDVVSETSDRFQSVVGPVLPWVDFLIVNEFEAGKIAGVPTRVNGKLKPEGLREAARVLLNRGVRRWVAIHFPEGALAANSKGQVIVQGSVRVPSEKIKGAAGAGDAFAAGFLYGMHEQWDIQASVRLGVSVAAVSLFDSTCSGSILPVDECLKTGERFGFRENVI